MDATMPAWLPLCCPACRGALVFGSDHYDCAQCSRRYPVIYGIPDFRLTPDPYISIEDDRAKGLRIARDCADDSLEGLLQFYWSITEDVEPARVRRFVETVLASRARGEDILEWLNDAEDIGGPVLELGCGAGGLLRAFAGPNRRIAGVDRGFRWLVVARRWLLREGIDVPLVCATADALPFPSGSFSTVIADGVIEHNETGQENIAAEAARVVNAGGRLFVSTPNRLCPAPDPHYRVVALGLFPAAWRATIVRWVRGKDYKHISLIGPLRLRRLLTSADLANVRLSPARFGSATIARFTGPTRAIVRIYALLARVPFVRTALTYAGPVLWCVGEKKESADG